MTVAPTLGAPAPRGFEAAYARRRRRSRAAWALGSAVMLALVLLTAHLSDVFRVAQVTTAEGAREWRWLIPAGLPRLGEYVAKTIPTLRWDSLGADLAQWFWRLDVWLGLLAETVLIAFMGTALGLAGGLLLSFPAARNLSPHPALRWVTRRALEVARTVPDLVFALIFVFCFGVGPLAGVLAIGLHTRAPSASSTPRPTRTSTCARSTGSRRRGARNSTGCATAPFPRSCPTS